MLAEGLTYPEAKELISTLATVEIEANLTVGAVRINPKVNEIEKAKEICEKAGAVVTEGNTSNLAGFILLAQSEKSGKKLKIPD